MLRSSTAVLIALSVLLPVSSRSDNRIVPGERVGDLRIGASRESARKLLGKPARSYVTHGKRKADVWRLGSAAEAVEAVYRENRVVQIATSVEKHRTRSGVGPQSRLSAAKRSVKGLVATNYLYDNETGNGQDYYDDKRSGVAFQVPSPWKGSGPERIYRVIVHRRGEAAIPTDIKDPSNRGTIEPKRRTDNASLTGDWQRKDETRTFHLWLVQNGKSLHGTHDVIMARGSRKDVPSREEGADDITIEGKVVRPGLAEVTFQSARDKKAKGKARLRLTRGELHWDVIGSAPGDHLFPYSATLKRQRVSRRGPISHDFLITPGHSIGNITLGLTKLADAHRSIGRPAEQRDREDGLHEEVWYGRNSPDFPNPRYRLTILCRNGRVEQIEVTNPDYKTIDGMCTNTRFKEIVRRHPELRVTEFGYDDLNARRIYYDDVARGIAYYVTASDEVLPESRPECIIVHRPGTPLIRRTGGVRYSPPELDKTRAARANP